MNDRELITAPGEPLPPGAKVVGDGVQFSIFSRNASSVILVLFRGVESGSPYDEVALDPVLNKTGDIWHIWVQGLPEGSLYGYRIDGSYRPEQGHRFNRHKLLIDPYARAITGNFKWNLPDGRGYDPASPEHDLSFSEIGSIQSVPRSIVVKDRLYTSDKQLGLPLNETVIYELHVKGFTKHESCAAANPGTFDALIDRIPYLKELGVTAVELMPVQEFDEFENINVNPLTGTRLKNYWGYSTLAFFSPKGSYSASGAMGEQIAEFKKMVRAYHEAGIEIILDVVFNHTGEGDHTGPTLSFKGIDNRIYYILEDNKRFYRNYSGCGNTFNCNHPMVHDFILDCLRYWVIKMHVDGFRFDLASILGRDQNGNILSNPPLINKIEQDPILRNTKIIAEAWDAAGAYQLGDFPGRWAEWNGKFRDDVRRFWMGEPGSIGHFATRVMGSSDLYWGSEMGPLHSINFVTCHDGFTMNDLVSYSRKHNLENGEENRDGENHNFSTNFGIEGASVTPLIDRFRQRQIKNYIATLFLSQGTPMMLMGDEFRRTQRGNNNSYCQDNDISWVDWGLLENNREIFGFVKNMIRFRKDHPVLRRDSFFAGHTKDGFSYPDITWHGPGGGEPDWSSPGRQLALLLNGEYVLNGKGEADSNIFIIFNSSMTGTWWAIPPSPSGRGWNTAVDTSNGSPFDFFEAEKPPLQSNRYFVNKLSTIVLVD
jgi:glycogen operon protein